LIHYWSFNSHIQDIVGGAHLFNGSNASLTNDRYGRPLSALNLNVGSYQMPKRNYFPNTNFTISLWFFLRANVQGSRVIEFSNFNASNSIMFVPYYKNGNRPGFSIKDDQLNDILYLRDLNYFPLKTWIHIGLVLEYPMSVLYFNGSRVSNGSCTQKPENLARNLNFIGRSSNYPIKNDIDGMIDELKIFDRALSNHEILFEMKN
jgi:hypothetical protein